MSGDPQSWPPPPFRPPLRSNRRARLSERLLAALEERDAALAERDARIAELAALSAA